MSSAGKRQVGDLQLDRVFAVQIPIIVMVVDQHCQALAAAEGRAAAISGPLPLPYQVGVAPGCLAHRCFRATPACLPMRAYMLTGLKTGLSIPWVEKARVPSKQRSATNINAQSNSLRSHLFCLANVQTLLRQLRRSWHNIRCCESSGWYCPRRRRRPSHPGRFPRERIPYFCMPGI